MRQLLSLGNVIKYRRVVNILVVLLLGSCSSLSACTPTPDAVPLPSPTPRFPSPTPGFADGLSSVTPYFTDPAIKGKNAPGRAIIKELINDIDAATDSIDVAMYNFTLEDVSDALIHASQRGLAVRIVVDSDALDKLDLQIMKKVGIYVLGDRRESLMHNKFVVIDNKILWTGSLNLTSSGAEKDENVQVRLVSPELAANYLLKFNEMFNEDHFGADTRNKTIKTSFNLSGIPVENYFSPEDVIDKRLVSLVGSAEESVHVLAYSFTLDRLADALINASSKGVKVRGVFDRESTEENQGADFSKLAKARLDVRLDGEPGLMHMKVIIVDGKTVAFGSYNFTASAENRNDENVLIITDPILAGSFEQAFERIYAKSE
jgi:phosphatidylserine/phosphatidylglycerophosphate/cardiolipin synthase-like enzyme